MVLLQLKDPLEPFVMRRESLIVAFVVLEVFSDYSKKLYIAQYADKNKPPPLIAE